MSVAAVDPCNIKYVYVELTLNKENKYDTVTGLFMGVVERNNEKFILVHGSKDTVAVLNTKFYGIVTVEILKDSLRELLYLKRIGEDQTTALQLLEETYAFLLKNDFGMKNDAKIIDIEKYKGVPDRYKEPVVDYSAPVGGVKSTTTTNTTTTPYSHGTTTTYNYNTGTNYYTKKDPVPALLGRTKSKKPTKPELDALQEKLNQIKAGTFVFELPETPEEKQVEEVPVAKTYGRGYYNGADDEFFGM